MSPLPQLVLALIACHCSPTSDTHDSEARGDSEPDTGALHSDPPHSGDTGQPGWQIDNLLTNPDFEEGAGHTLSGWANEEGGGSWSEEMATSGSHSAKLEAGNGSEVAWTQSVPVTGGTLYRFYGQAGFEGITGDGASGLQLLWYDDEERLLERVALPDHSGSRELALDYPPGLSLRAPDDATRATVVLALTGPGRAWWDDIVLGEAPLGTIRGTIRDPDGSPLEGATVSIIGEPWDRSYQAVTDADGAYALDETPVSMPRYVLQASLDGYRSRSQGEVAPSPDYETIVDFELRPGTDPELTLRARFGHLATWSHVELDADLLARSVLPNDPSAYPDEVQVHLEAGEFIDPEHRSIQAVAETILAEVDDPGSTYEVARAAFEWIVRNIEYEGLYTAGSGLVDDPWLDVTTSAWMSLSDDGWAWGTSFSDWITRPDELLAIGSSMCADHGWLTAGLMRSLGIPARAAQGTMEFWAQDSTGEGSWFEISTANGRGEWRENGTFGYSWLQDRLTSYPVDANGLTNSTWECDNGCLWKEVHPWGERYMPDDDGLAEALVDLASFADDGTAPSSTVPSGTGSHHRIIYRDVTIHLGDMVEQDSITVRFPMISPTEVYSPSEHYAYWTNLEDQVVDVRVSTQWDPSGTESLGWLEIEYDLRGLLD